MSLAFGRAGLHWREYVVLDRDLYRPSEVNLRLAQLGDASKARRALGWQPRVRFADLVREMVQLDLRAYGLEDKLKDTVSA